MGGKSSTTTQQVQIPPEVMARYRSVNQRAEAVGGTPFQQYSTDPSAFVAPINPTQAAGIQNIGSVQNAALPFYGAGAQLTMGGAGSVGPVSGQDIGRYMSPYLGSVVGTTLANLSQEQAMQRQQQIGDAIKSGAFGGDRAGLAAANLARQQGMAYGSTAANLLNQGYGQALGAAQAYQGVEAQNLARQLQAGQQIAGLGSGLTQTGIAAGQALLGAGTAQQQTDQAGLSALYNQFQQERSYPFQVAQFLANIAMGTGALSGSTTTTTQPVPFFSDPRLKENMREIGQTHDGLPLYAFNYKGRPGETQIGLNADEVEQVKPEAVGLAGGYKTVDYDAATRPRGGLDPMSSMGGAVIDLEPGEYRENFAAGGAPDFSASLAQLYAMFGTPHGAQPGGGLAGPYGGRQSYVPPANLPVGQLRTADTRGIIRSPTSMAQEMMGATSGVRDFGKTASDLYGMGEAGLGRVRSAMQTGPSRAAPPPPVSPAAPPAAALPQVEIPQGYETERRRAYGGLAGYAAGGDVDDPMESYGPRQGGLDIPTEQPDIKPLEPAKPPSPPNSIFGDILGAAKTAASIYSMSDERMKRGMEPVGELYNGLPVYRYSIGDGPTQIGLSAQEASGLHPGAAIADRSGILHLDYDRATRAYGGGLVPRMGYAEGGVPSFEDALNRTLQFEGGYTVDTGGPTMMGISSRANPDVDLDRVSRDPQYKANIYRERYWNPIGAESMDRRMAPIAFDTAVNLGVGGARRLLEQAGGDPEKLLDLRQKYYNDLIARNPEKYGAYERSWANRVNALRQGLGAGDRDIAPVGAQEVQGGGTPPGAQQRGLVASMLPTKRDPRTGEETTDWKKIIIPALTGLGAMASSPSLYAGSAILQGLGAGAQAYSNLEKREADIAQTQAGTAQTEELTSELKQLQIKGDLIDGPLGPEVIMPGGRRIPAGEWNRLNRPPTRSAARETRGLPQAPVTPAVSAGAGAGAGKAAGVGTTADAGAGAAAGAIPAGLPKEIADVGDQNYAYVSNSNLQQLAADKNTNDPFTFAADAANKVYGSRMQSMQFAKALSDLPAGGKITSQIINPLKERALNLLTLAGVPAANMPDLVSDVSAADIAAKVRNSLATANVRGPAVEELNKVFAAIPSDLNSKEGQAQLISSFLVDQQEARERARMFNDYRRYMESKYSLTPGYSLYSGRGLNEAFEAKMRAQYQDDKKILSSMFQDKFYRADKKTPAMVLDGQPATVMSYLISNSGRIPDKGLEKALISKYGEAAIRRAQQYFGG